MIRTFSNKALRQVAPRVTPLVNHPDILKWTWTSGLATIPPTSPQQPRHAKLVENFSPSMIAERPGFFARILKKLTSSNEKAYAINLLVQCTDGTDIQSFFDSFDMPDSLYSWFLVSELHLWMVFLRIMSEKELNGLKVRNLMIEMFWKDCERRAKLIGKMSMSARSEQVLAMSEEFNAAVLIYDAGISGSDKDLAYAVWRRFFLSTEEPDFVLIEKLVRYIRRTVNALEETDIHTLMSTPTLKWLPIEEETK